MNDNEPISTNTSVTPAVGNLQNQQVSLSSPVKKNRCGAVSIFQLFSIIYFKIGKRKKTMKTKTKFLDFAILCYIL